MKLPFYISQSIDDVLKVAKRTNRRRLALEFTDHGGETYYFNLDAFSARERREKREAMEAELEGKRVDLGRIPVVKYVYDDCELTFERGRGPKGDGALVYRITRIEAQDILREALGSFEESLRSESSAITEPLANLLVDVLREGDNVKDTG